MAARSALRTWLEADHRRLESLLDASVRTDGSIETASYEAFRAGLLRHIGIEEKIVFPAARRAANAPLPQAVQLRIDHAAITSLLVPTPDRALVDEIRGLLARHDVLEEGVNGTYESCDACIAPGEIDALVREADGYPAVPLARHFDGHGTHRTAASALEAATRTRARRDAEGRT